jgi:glycosyltransferase involved in cell wall biosynthesis
MGDGEPLRGGYRGRVTGNGKSGELGMGVGEWLKTGNGEWVMGNGKSGEWVLGNRPPFVSVRARPCSSACLSVPVRVGPCCRPREGVAAVGGFRQFPRTMGIHLLKIIRGFNIDGPGRLVLSLLRAWQPAELRLTVVALSGQGKQRPAIEAEVARLGGTLHVLPTRWLDVHRTAERIMKAPWFPTVTHLGAHLLRPDAVARRISRKSGLPCLITDHGLHALGEGGPLLTPFARLWYRRSVTSQLHFAAVSEKVSRQLLALGVPDAQVSVMPNGVDLRAFRVATAEERRELRWKLNIPEDAFPVVAVVGSLTANKDPLLAVETVAALGKREGFSPYLLFCGDGPLREAVTARIAERGLKARAQLLGLSENPSDLYNAADLLLHASPQESFGLVVAEATASGLPCLVRAGSGADLVAGPAPLSLAVEGTDPATWAASLATLAAPLRDERDSLAALARAHAESHFSIARTAALYLELLRAQSAS